MTPLTTLQEADQLYSMSQPKTSPKPKKNDFFLFKATSRKTPEQWARILASRAKHLPEVFVTD